MLIPPQPPQLVTTLRNQEGVRHTAYQDSLGNWTIGAGHLGAYPGEVWTNAQVDAALEKDITIAATGLDKALPWLKGLGAIRWASLVNQCFNMGLGNLLNFHEQLAALQACDWVSAVKAMQSSAWYRQVPSRVDAISLQIITDTWVTDYLDKAQKQQLTEALS